MISRFFPLADTEDTVLNYYALPLVGVNRRIFGENLISTHLTKDGRHVLVKLHKDVYTDLEMSDKLRIKDSFYVYYAVPEMYLKDVVLLLQSKYSKLSKEAKVCIKKDSGLMYKKMVNGKTYTSKLLYALDRKPTLLKYMFECLKSGDNSDSDEILYSILKESELADRLHESDVI